MALPTLDERPTSTSRYSRFILVGAAISMVLTLFGAATLGLTYLDIKKEQTKRLEVIGPAARNLSQLYRSYIDQETSMRGYTISQDRTFLEPYRSAATRIPIRRERLQQLAAQIPGGGQRVATLSIAHQNWVSRVAIQQISAIGRGDQAAAIAIVVSGEGNRYFDDIRREVAKFERFLTKQRLQSDAKLVALQDRLATLLLISLASLMILIGASAWLLRRRVVEPMTAEIEEQAGLIDLAQDAIITRTIEGPITFWSHGAEELYGFSKEEAVGKILRNLLNTKLPESKTVMQERFFREGTWTGLITHTTKSGDEVMVASRWLLRRDADGNPASILEVNTNVTDRSLTALRAAAEAQFRSAKSLSIGFAEVNGGLEEAIDAGQILAHYQPIVNLADHRIVGVEALMRWDHPELGILPPAAFFDQAMEHHLLERLSEEVLSRALHDLDGWKHEGLFVSINLENRQLLSSGLPQRLRRVAESSGVSPQQIWLEIPESLYADHFSGAVQVIEELRALGFVIALDDFGTGTSSLDWISQVPVDVLKVAARFVKGIGQRPSDQAVLRAVAGLGRELGVRVVAEGIESDEQRDMLAELDYELGQGFLFSRPVDRATLVEQLLPSRVLHPDLLTRS